MGETLGHPAARSLDLQATSSNDSVARLPTEILERVLDSFSGVPPRIARSVGPLTVFNERGHRPPIFWCFNHYAEPVLLAARLGADQPLYAMHSFQGILDDWREKQRYGPLLAQVYAEAILSAAGAARILIGGNCQSADIIEIAARTIAKRRGTTPLLMMLESEPALPYGGPLLMMFGDRSGYNNPFLKEADPVGRWWSRHANFAWGIVRGIHGSYFREPGIFDLTGFLRQAVDAIEQTGRLAPGEMRRSEGLHPA